jgi:hypothetical protein
MESNITTKYGKIVVVLQDGIKKCNFDKCKFKSAQHMLAFCQDKKFLKEIFGY